MVNHNVWQSLHVLCILAHIGMMITGAVLFVLNGSSSLNNHNTSHIVLPWAAVGVGIFGTGSNGSLFGALLGLHYGPSQSTDEIRDFWQIVALSISSLLNILLVGADIAIASVTAGHVRNKNDLAVVVTLAYLAGLMSLGTSVADISLLREYQKQSNDDDQVRVDELIILTSSDTDANV